MKHEDKPTDSQINTLYSWYRWRLPIDLARDAVKWLQNNATKQDVSKEIARVHDLYHDFGLNEESCFESPIWKGYKIKEEDV